MEPWSIPINKRRWSEKKGERKERQTKQRGRCQKKRGVTHVNCQREVRR